HPDLHSFPTRRSSDLHNRLVAGSSPAGPTIPFGHVGPHWTIPARNHRFRSFQRRKAALRETPLAPCWTHHLRWSTDLISKLSARDRKSTRLNSSHVKI